jgi:hypothetical protein
MTWDILGLAVTGRKDRKMFKTFLHDGGNQSVGVQPFTRVAARVRQRNASLRGIIWQLFQR